MKARFTALVPYMIVLGADFYLLPFGARDTGAAMLLMLCVMPVIALGSAVVYGMRNGFSLILPIAALLLFIPSVFIHYNASAWIYAPAYAVVVLAGVGIGRALYRKR